MRTRIVVGTLLVFGALASTMVTANVVRRSAIVHFTRPTIVAGTFVFGRVVIVHDDEKMARGEACTTVYRFDPKAARGEGDSLVNFHCQPKARLAANKVVVTSQQLSPAGPSLLMEYQLVGETEGHGVPMEP